jgi:integrase
VAPRHRHSARRDWPRGLRGKRNADGSIYYSWIHPDTGKEWGIGTMSFAKAAEQAREANLEVNRKKLSLAERIEGGGETIGTMLDKYEKRFERRKHKPAENTVRCDRSRRKRTIATFGQDTPLRAITTEMVAQAIDAIIEEGKERLAQSMRSYWREFFKFCIAKGAIELNPADATERVHVEVKRARLLFDVFMRLYKQTESSCVWLHNAMALALVSLQGRNEICGAAVSQFRDGGWYVDRRKTKAKLFIPGHLRLNAFGMSLDEVYKQCRSTRVLSKYLIHQTENFGNSPRGAPIWLDTVSRRFSDELAKLGIDWGDKEAPTFHEIRSLGVRLYTQQGGVDVQALAAHADAEMTELYADPRGAEYVRVKVDQ